jgi:hypothetical protein
MKTKIVITNHQLGSDNTLFFEYAVHTWQGRRRVEYWAEFLSKRSNLPVYVYTRFNWQENKKPFLTIGGN